MYDYKALLEVFSERLLCLNRELTRSGVFLSIRLRLFMKVLFHSKNWLQSGLDVVIIRSIKDGGVAQLVRAEES